MSFLSFSTEERPQHARIWHLSDWGGALAYACGRVGGGGGGEMGKAPILEELDLGKRLRNREKGLMLN